MRRLLALSTATLLAAPAAATPLAAQTPLAGHPGVLLYGDIDGLDGRSITIPANAYAGATLIGLLPGQTSAAGSFGHTWPYAPETGAGADFAGTDQIFTAPGQTGFNDGYSQYAGRVQGANAMTLDYSSLLSPGRAVTTFTLGIAADDFQTPALGQAFEVKVNGSVHAGLTSFLNGINQTGPSTQLFTFGLDPKLLAGSSLALTITQKGDGRDGWGIDYLTVGVETAPVVTAAPEPATLALAGSGLLALAAVARRRRA